MHGADSHVHQDFWRFIMTARNVIQHRRQFWCDADVMMVIGLCTGVIHHYRFLVNMSSIVL